MVSYQRWTALLFEANPNADATVVVSAAGRSWRENKQLIKGATVAEARKLAKRVR